MAYAKVVVEQDAQQSPFGLGAGRDEDGSFTVSYESQNFHVSIHMDDTDVPWVIEVLQREWEKEQP